MKGRNTNIILRIGVLLIIIVLAMRFYSKYLQDKPIAWTLIFIGGLILIGFLSVFLYKQNRPAWFKLQGISFSIIWALRFFIFGILLLLSGAILSIIYIYKDPAKLPSAFLAFLFGIISIVWAVRTQRFARKIAKGKIK